MTKTTSTASELTTCTTCCRPVGAPFRRHDAHGKVIEGCVDEAHTGHLYGSSREWHVSDVARQIRRDTAERLSAMLGEPMRGYGMPGKLKLIGENRPVR